MSVAARAAAARGPLYARIAESLEDEIRRGHAQGDPLPSEQSLAQRFGVNKHTLRRAVDELANSGLVERRRGIGLFVLDPKINYRIGESTRFTSRIDDLGRSAATRVLQRQLLRADDAVAKQLGVKPGKEIVAIETLRSVDGRPFCVISHFLDAQRFRGLVDAYRGGSLHRLLERDHGLTLRRARSLITTALPQGDDGRLLGIGRLQPVLRVSSVNRDAVDDRIVEHAITRFRGDRVELAIDL